MIDLGLAELHNVRDSVAPRSYVVRLSLILGCGYKARSYIG